MAHCNLRDNKAAFVRNKNGSLSDGVIFNFIAGYFSFGKMLQVTGLSFCHSEYNNPKNTLILPSITHSRVVRITVT